MKHSETLKSMIDQRSKSLKGLYKQIKGYRSKLLINKMVRNGLSETLKGMKADLKAADREGNYEMASSIRRMINATRQEVASLLNFKRLNEKYITYYYTSVRDLQSEIQALDTAWEAAKASEAQV